MRRTSKPLEVMVAGLEEISTIGNCWEISGSERIEIKQSVFKDATIFG